MYLFKKMNVFVHFFLNCGLRRGREEKVKPHQRLLTTTIWFLGQFMWLHLAPYKIQNSQQNTKFTTEDKYTKYRTWNTKYHNFVPRSTWLRLYLGYIYIKVVDDGNGNRYKAKTFFTKSSSEANKERMLWMLGLEGNSGASLAVRGIPEARNRKGLRWGWSWGKWVCSTCSI